jgi:NADPH:quinone reductase-like Zn-dependent oxidoreductase
LLNTLRCNSNKIEFPLTLGRDFVGTVVQKGMEIDNSEFKLGDKIWGVVPVHRQGAHAEYVKVDKCHVSIKPANISDSDAAALLYAGLTAYSGIFFSAQLNGVSNMLCNSKVQGSAVGKKVLVMGASGGVGHLAVQILLAEGADVVATCSQEAIPLVCNLGASKVIDYTAAESDQMLLSESPYDVILDCAGKGAEYASTLPWNFGNYITFKSPLLRNFDDQGMLVGGLNNIKDLLAQNISVNRKGVVKWGYFLPTKNGISYLKHLVESKKLLPVIDSKFTYSDLTMAYAKVQSGHLRGKVVIEF